MVKPEVSSDRLRPTRRSVITGTYDANGRERAFAPTVLTHSHRRRRRRRHHRQQQVLLSMSRRSTPAPLSIFLTVRTRSIKETMSAHLSSRNH